MLGLNKNIPAVDILSQLGLKEQLHCGHLTLLCRISWWSSPFDTNHKLIKFVFGIVQIMTFLKDINSSSCICLALIDLSMNKEDVPLDWLLNYWSIQSQECLFLFVGRLSECLKYPFKIKSGIFCYIQINILSWNIIKLLALDWYQF